MQRTPLAFDIETVGVDWESLAPSVQQYLLDRARSDEERETVPDRLGLSAGTGQVVAIGMWRPLERRGGVLVNGDGPAQWEDFEEGNKIFIGSERQILEEFWRHVTLGAGTIVTFNGRSFDGPFLMIRSAILGVRPTRNLVPYRYSFHDHCDLAEALSFHRSTPMFSFDYWCHQFGLESPKSEMDGSMVAKRYAAGDLMAIARYGLKDARLTGELFVRMMPMIAALEGKPVPGWESSLPS